MTLHTEIEIAANADRVWQILMDFPAYPMWNPFIKRISGNAIVGAKIEAFIEPPGGKEMMFTPTVLAATPNREFRWLGKFLVRGLFDGEHSFQIEPLADGGVRFVQSEKFGGLLIPLFRKSLLTQTKKGFEMMNQALKARAEGKG